MITTIYRYTQRIMKCNFKKQSLDPEIPMTLSTPTATRKMETAATPSPPHRRRNRPTKASLLLLLPKTVRRANKKTQINRRESDQRRKLKSRVCFVETFVT